jgi:hypothetical protein
VPYDEVLTNVSAVRSVFLQLDNAEHVLQVDDRTFFPEFDTATYERVLQSGISDTAKSVSYPVPLNFASSSRTLRTPIWARSICRSRKVLIHQLSAEVDLAQETFQPHRPHHFNETRNQNSR